MYRQQGIALITAMLIVAIVATIATYLSLNQTIWLRQAQNLADLAQAEAASTSGLSAAALLLALEAQKNTATDHLGEDWAKPLPTFPVEGGALTIHVADAQARFNLNNLSNDKAPEFQKYSGMFRRLLQSAGLNPDLTDALIDWMDQDDSPRPNGAEDSTYYLTLPSPYRAANRPLQTVDELRLVRGFNAETVQKLRPLVVVLPVATDVNINTAPAEVIDAMFAAPPGVSAVQQMISGREKTPFNDCAALEARNPGQPLAVKCNVKTGYFEVMIDAQFGRLSRHTLGLIERSSNKASVKWQRQYLVKDLRLAKP